MNNRITKFRKRTNRQNKNCVVLKVIIHLTNIINTISYNLKFFIIIFYNNVKNDYMFLTRGFEIDTKRNN